ncbi:MAG: DUF6106 family protein [Wujia sp.]
MDNYAEYAVKKKLVVKDRMPIVASVFAALIGFAIWAVKPGWIGPTILVLGIVFVIITSGRQEIEYEYIFLSGECEISRIVKKSSRKQIYKFDIGDVQRVHPYKSQRFKNELEANPSLQIRDYTSGYSDHEDNWYVFLNNGNNHTVAAVLELNEKCADHVRYFYKEKYQE